MGDSLYPIAKVKVLDGSAVPVSEDTEDKAVKPSASKYGVVFTNLTTEDGSGSAIINHDSAIGSGQGKAVVISGAEAKDFDGSALPNSDAEGYAGRVAASLYGVQYTMLTSEDGSQSPYDSVNNAIQVEEIADARQQTETVEIQAATTIDATETAIGGEISVLGYNTMTIWLDYTKGDETGVYIRPKYLRVSGGDEHQVNTWSSAAGTKTVTADEYYLTASGKHYIVLDVRGINIVKIYDVANAGTPTGTLQVGVTLSNN